MPGQDGAPGQLGAPGRLGGPGQSGVPGQQGQPGGGRFQRRTGPQASGQRPARQRSSQPPDRELRHRAIAALVFGALSLIALLSTLRLGGDLQRGVYLLFFSTIIGVAACVIGITALRKARRTGSYRPRGAVGGIILGALAVLISIPILVAYLAYPTQVNNYVRCLSQAQSSSEQQACMNQFYNSIHLRTSGSGQLLEHSTVVAWAPTERARSSRAAVTRHADQWRPSSS